MHKQQQHQLCSFSPVQSLLAQAYSFFVLSSHRDAISYLYKSADHIRPQASIVIVGCHFEKSCCFPNCLTAPKDLKAPTDQNVFFAKYSSDISPKKPQKQRFPR
jgi:hypothetical protein